MEIGLELYYVGFLDLINSRQTGFGEGPIEWLTIHDYCQAQGIEGEQRQDFFYHIRQMDSAYLKFKSKKNKPGKPAKGAKKSGSPT